MDGLDTDVLEHIALSLQAANDILSFAATCKVNKEAGKASAASHAGNVVKANGREPDHFDASSFKRNLRLIGAGLRKAQTLAKTIAKATRAEELIGMIVPKMNRATNNEQVIHLSQLHRREQSKLNDINDKLRRHKDEIFWVADGAALADVEIVSVAESDDDDEDDDDDDDDDDHHHHDDEEEDDERSWFPNLSGELDESDDESESDL